MSDPLRVACTANGPAGALAIEAVLSALPADVEFAFQTLPPEGSRAFESTPFADIRPDRAGACGRQAFGPMAVVSGVRLPSVACGGSPR